MHQINGYYTQFQGRQLVVGDSSDLVVALCKGIGLKWLYCIGSTVSYVRSCYFTLRVCGCALCYPEI